MREYQACKHQKEQKKEPEEELEQKNTSSPLKVLGKIDLESLNTSTHPEKKGKSEK